MSQLSIVRFFMVACLALILQSSELVLTRAQAPSAAPNANVTMQAAQSQLLFTVIDKESHFVGTLQAADVRLLENDKPQEIIAFRKLEDQPVSLAILIDTSLSQEKTLPQLKAVADSFLQAIMRPEKDQAAIVTFTGKMTIEQSFTNDIAQLRLAVLRTRVVLPKGYKGIGVVVQGPPPSADEQIAAMTATWDAVWNTTEQLLAPVAAGTRKAIILLTDGQDTASHKKMRETIERTVRANVAVYSIGIGERYSFGIDEGALRKISEQTGGRAFIPKKGQDLTMVFAEIQQELRYHYEITYQSATSNIGASRKLRLEIINPSLRAQGLQISYQRIAIAPGK